MRQVNTTLMTKRLKMMNVKGSIMKKLFTLTSGLLLTSLVMTSIAYAQTTISVITTADTAGEGFNDPTVVAPIGGNPMTTLGEQRLFVFQTAANIWAEILNSDVEIVVNAQFSPQTCTMMGSTLGSAGAASVFSDFANAPVANRLYNVALANSLAGTDLNGGTPEINSTFNSDIDTGCSGSTGWYYGVDGNAPAGTINLFPVILHELGHGLGFQTFTSNTTGAFLGGTPDIWTDFLFDLEFNDFWINLTQAERQASAINDPDLTWDGPSVNNAFPTLLSFPQALVIDTPASIAGTYEAMTAAFGPLVPIEGIAGNIILIDDGVGPDTTDGCEPIINGAALNGNIALIRRGNCPFTDKTINAQNFGAIGVIISDNVPASLPPLGGDDPLITISTIGISQADGDLLETQLPAPGVTGSLTFDETQDAAGTNSGFVRMNGPDPVVPGSSVSHWTPDTFPNTLMEPAITASLFDDVDLTVNLFQDIGWSVNLPVSLEEEFFADGFEAIE